MKNLLTAFTFATLAFAAQAHDAPVHVDGAWARATVPGQSGSGAFMRIRVRDPLTLVGASTPAAGIAEVHEMKMEGEVMRMRAAGPLEIKPGRPLELKPNGYHIMLMQLKEQLKPDTKLPLTLVFKDAKGAELREEISVPVSLQAPEAHKH